MAPVATRPEPPSCNLHEPSVEALRALADRLVVAVGADSGEEMTARGARSVAASLGTAPVTSPGGHDGFTGGEFGQPPGDPDGSAARLVAVLA